MEKWQNFYLQRMGSDGNGSEYPVKESVSTWGIWCKDIPFLPMSKVKSPAKRTWNDEHGDDEYIGEGGLYLESYEIDIEFGCKKMSSAIGKAQVDDVRVRVGDFLQYLRGGMLKIYSSYTRIGRQNVRLESFDKGTWKSENGQEFLVFTIKFKVNDPVTDVTLP